ALLFAAAIQGEPLTAEQKEKLAKASEFVKEADKLNKDGKYTDAVDKASKALALRKEVLGENHSDYASCQSLLGELLYLTGDLARPEVALEAARAWQQKNEPEHPATAHTLHRLGYLRRERGEFPAAKKAFTEALELRQKIAGNHHPSTASTLSGLGS